MSKYFINYQTGAGNFSVKADLEKVIAAAVEGIAYTQQSIIVTDEDDDEVARLPWYGTKAEADDIVTVDYGEKGFYGEWIIVKRPGRPALPEEEKRKPRSVKMSDEEWEEIQRRAALKDISAAEYIRRKALSE